MAGEDNGSAVLDSILNGGERGADSFIAGNLVAVIKRDVEVGADEDGLVLEVEILDGQLCHSAIVGDDGGGGAGDPMGRMGVV